MKSFSILFTVVLLLFSKLLIAQQQEEKRCFTVEMDQELVKQHPEILKTRAQLEQSLQEWIKQHPYLPTSSGNYIIPVVFHILHNYGLENISDAQVRDQVRIWNEDYQKKNADITDVTISQFASIAANCGIEFRLATIDPNGNCTNGIDRIATQLTYHADDNSKLNAWPNSKYLNIWTAASLALAGAAAYAYYPPNTCPQCGVLSISTYIGSIGTGNYGLARVISHETGHCFNLLHTFGNTNTCGDPANCSDGGDYVSDTPLTQGWCSCPGNLNQGTCGHPGSPDNIQNFMEYSYCCRMFTQGQASRMVGALTTAGYGLTNLWSSSNLAATGTADPYDTTNNYANLPLCSPIADFTTPMRLICVGSSIRFTDCSYNGQPTSWNWSFQGGTPTTSTDQMPTIQYDSIGSFYVTLIDSNASGSSSPLTKTFYIVVADSTAQAIPLSEGFELPEPFPPNNCYVMNPDNGQTWQRYQVGSGGSSYSMRIFNYSGNPVGATDDYITPAYNFSNVISPKVNFDIAYTHRSSDTTRADGLRVYYSTDCGQSWTLRYSKSGSALVTTSPRSSSSPFTPTTSQWRTETIGGIGFLAGKPNVRFKFQAVSAAGNNLYLDNINITDIDPVLEINNPVSSFEIYPNPAKDQMNIDVTLEKASDMKIELFDLTGRKILSIFNDRAGAGIHRFPVNHHLQDGVYLIQMICGGAAISKRVIILD